MARERRDYELLRSPTFGFSPDRETQEYIAMLLKDPCSYCGRPGVTTVIDHIERGRGGTWENLTAACRACNSGKSKRSMLHYIGLRPWELRRVGPNNRRVRQGQQVTVHLPPEVFDEVRSYRWRGRFDSRAEAVIDLVRRGLAADAAARESTEAARQAH